jgi:hypothetical protein
MTVGATRANARGNRSVEHFQGRNRWPGQNRFDTGECTPESVNSSSASDRNPSGRSAGSAYRRDIERPIREGVSRWIGGASRTLEAIAGISFRPAPRSGTSTWPSPSTAGGGFPTGGAGYSSLPTNVAPAGSISRCAQGQGKAERSRPPLEEGRAAVRCRGIGPG